MTSNVTAAQIDRTAKDWTKIAGETVTVEQVGAVLYGFTSEIGTLRLLKAYRTVERADCGYSVNMKRHYFVLELNI